MSVESKWAELPEDKWSEAGDVEETPTPTVSPGHSAGSPTPFTSALRGYGQGASLGFDDEIGGAIGAFDELTKRAASVVSSHPDDQPIESESLPLFEAIKARYRRERDANRTEQKAAFATNPKSYLGGQLAGAVMTPGPTGKTGVARMALGTGTGALAGLGSSEANTAGGMARDTMTGGAFGAAGAGLGVGLGALGNKAGELAQRIRAAYADGRIEKLRQAAASAAGTAGQATRRVIDTIEEANKVVGGTPSPQGAAALVDEFGRALPPKAPPPPSLIDAAQETLDNPAVMDLYETAARNKFANANSAARAAEAAKKAASEAATDIPGRAAAETDAYFSSRGPVSETVSRMGPLAQRLALGAAGGALGGLASEKLGIDKRSGLLGGAVMGFNAPGTLQAARNWAKSPAVQEGLMRWLQGGTDAASRALGGASRAYGQTAVDERNSQRAAQMNSYRATKAIADRYGIDIGDPEKMSEFWFANE